MEALTASEAYYAADPAYRHKAGTPWNLAFLAMAHHRLGEEEQAQALLARLRELMKDPRLGLSGRSPASTCAKPRD